MAFDLTMGTERAQALQDSIQDELTKRGYSPDADPVMAEYITIMLINNKTPDQITAELQDLIGTSEYDPTFTDWLFAEAAKKSDPPAPPTPAPSTITSSATASAAPTSPPQEPSKKPPTGPRSGAPLYSQAIQQAIPTSSSFNHGQKRTASARSPSPQGGNVSKSRRTDLPTGPRAMGGGVSLSSGGGSGGRSLLERMNGPSRRNNQNGGGYGRDEIQARIDAVTAQGLIPPEMLAAQMQQGFPNGNPMMMDGMNQVGQGMVNPLALQEMMMNQMALMAQMASTMGLIPGAGQMPMMNGVSGGTGMNGVPANVGNGFNNDGHQRRGGAPSGRGRGRGGQSSASWVAPHIANAETATTSSKSKLEAHPNTPLSANAPVFTPSASHSSITATPAIAAPTPLSASSNSTSIARPGVSPPSRPSSPTLCKFGVRCTNALCKYAHPSPVATPESGIVLSNEACENGRNCKDKDCTKAHVSPAAATVPPGEQVAAPPKPVVAPAPAQAQIPCRYGSGCLRIKSGCPFVHPYNPQASSHFNQQCRFGASCTRATCPFQHPPGRTALPGTFHRGLSDKTPSVNIRAPETGAMGASPHRSVVFNRPAPAGNAATTSVSAKPADSTSPAEGEKKNEEAKIVEAAA